MKRSRKRLALLIAYGPETRAFLHSGLAARLAERHEIVILTTRPESQVFWRYRGYEIAAAPATARPRGLARLDSMCERGAGMIAASRASDHVQRTAGRLFGCDVEWKRLFEELGIDAVLAASYNSVRTLPALQTARRLGLPITVVANSWKDVYAKPYAPVRPDVLGLGSRAEAAHYLEANPAASKDSVFLAGSLHLAALLNAEPTPDRGSFLSAEGLDPRRPVLCYSAASAKAAPEEGRIVEMLLDAIESGRIGEQPQLVLRLNPMDEGARFEALAASSPNLTLQRPRWEWSADADWCCALADDVGRWAATLRHAVANISIASTVTLECAALGRPVINPLFGSESAAAVWNKPFYGEARRQGWARGVHGEEELIAAVNHAICAPAPQPAFELTTPNPIEITARAVETAMGPKQPSAVFARRFTRRFSQA